MSRDLEAVIGVAPPPDLPPRQWQGFTAVPLGQPVPDFLRSGMLQLISPFYFGVAVSDDRKSPLLDWSLHRAGWILVSSGYPPCRRDISDLMGNSLLAL